MLPDFWSRDPERLHRLEVEAQAAALIHPNIVSIFHVGQYNGFPYIVTELLHGDSLRERLRHGPMRVREAIDVGIEIAQGLAAAHGAGIIHRDLKPENIFITKDGRTKILDFGVAKLDPYKTSSVDSPTASYQLQSDPGHVLGTVGYMSPEQVRASRRRPQRHLCSRRRAVRDGDRQAPFSQSNLGGLSNRIELPEQTQDRLRASQE
jgi:serine/threonine protein kinase